MVNFGAGGRSMRQILPQETDRVAAQAEFDAAVVFDDLPPGSHCRKSHRRLRMRFLRHAVEQRQAVIGQAAVVHSACRTIATCIACS